MIKGTRFARQAGLFVSLVVLVSASAFAQSSFDFLPDEVQDALQYAEETRADLEERREEISEEVTQGPYETDEEFSQRMERAMERGASRERRYLGVELSELAETEFTVDPDRISVQPHRRPARGEEWPITISTDLGMLDEEEEFTVRAPADSASAIDDAVAENALDAEIRYHLEGNTDDDGYFVMLDEVRLLDMARQRTLIDSVPMFVSYVFSESQELTRDSGPANFDFADGAIPTDFTMRGDADWTVTTETSSVGSHSLRAGDISHNGRTEAVYTGIVPEGRRLVGISFARRVSSESVYDELDFEVNGETRDSWSGNVGWDTVSFDTDIRSNERFELVWRYHKDSSVDNGQDTAWIDDIHLDFE